MNHTIENPVGIDAKIHMVQTFIYDRIGWENIDVFGKVFKVPSKSKKGGDTIEAYVGKNEYRDVFTNDKKTANIFFIEDDKHTTKEGILYKNEVSVVFMVNLKKLYPEIRHRADMEAEADAMKVLKASRILRLPEIEKEVKAIFEKLNIENIKLSNMQPYHVFAIRGEMAYYLNSKCNNN